MSPANLKMLAATFWLKYIEVLASTLKYGSKFLETCFLEKRTFSWMKCEKRSKIRETMNLSMCADNSPKTKENPKRIERKRERKKIVTCHVLRFRCQQLQSGQNLEQDKAVINWIRFRME